MNSRLQTSQSLNKWTYKKNYVYKLHKYVPSPVMYVHVYLYL
jgi:hypothetical protein